MIQSSDYFDLLTKKEPLHEDLVPYVFDGPFGPCLKHPLVFAIVGFDQERAAFYNRQYQEKKKLLKEYEQSKDFGAAIFLHERPYRFEFFAKIAHNLDAAEYWQAFADAWIDSENIWQYNNLIRSLLKNKKHAEYRHLIMNEDERKYLASLPDTIEIWRGCIWKNRNGLSWTLDKEKAVWFAKRLGTKTPYLHSGVVAKKKVIAYLNGRSEDEVIVFTKDISNKLIERI